MNWDGDSPTRLTEHTGIDQFPDWSPDGRRIAFRRDTDIYVMDLASGETTRLTNAPPLNQMPAWSPNGQQLAFMSAREGYPSVFVMNADGSEQTNLTPKDPGDLASDWVSRAPAWSRNGRQIYFMSSRPSTGLDTELFVINRRRNRSHPVDCVHRHGRQPPGAMTCADARWQLKGTAAFSRIRRTLPCRGASRKVRLFLLRCLHASQRTLGTGLRDHRRARRQLV